MRFSKEKRKTISFLNFSGTSISIPWKLLWRFGCLILLCWQRNETSNEQIPCHPPPPRERHSVFCCSLLCSEAATFISPFFANFSANASQPHGCSQPVKLLLQNCTALREVCFIYMLVPCPGLQGQLHGHRGTVIYPHSPWQLSASVFLAITLSALAFMVWEERRRRLAWQLPAVWSSAQRPQGSILGAATQSLQSCSRNHLQTCSDDKHKPLLLPARIGSVKTCQREMLTQGLERLTSLSSCSLG